VFGAQVALLYDAVLLIGSGSTLEAFRVEERRDARVAAAAFGTALVGGLRFVARHRLLVALALMMGGWQMAHDAAITVQILFTKHTHGLTEPQVGLPTPQIDQLARARRVDDGATDMQAQRWLKDRCARRSRRG
jgi:hypothetical protein